MYKRRENSFLVTAAAPKKFSDEGGWRRERQRQRQKKRERIIMEVKRIMPSSFILPREDKWKMEKMARAKGC